MRTTIAPTAEPEAIVGTIATRMRSSEGVLSDRPASSELRLFLASLLPVVIVLGACGSERPAPPDCEHTAPSTPEHVASCERDCTAGAPAACVAVGDALVAAKPAEPEPRAAAAYLRACELGDVAACRQCGVLHEEGRGADKDELRAAELYKKACDGSDAAGCFLLGRLHDEGRGAPFDSDRAAELYARACDGNVGEACHRLALAAEASAKGTSAALDGVYLPREWRDALDEERKHAVSLFLRSCDLGYLPACYDAVVTKRPEDMMNASRRFATLILKGCDSGDARACAGGGRLHERGSGVDKDEVLAADLYARGCKLGSVDGCVDLAQLYLDDRGVPKDPAKATALFEQACDLGAARWCFEAGKRRLEGRGVPTDAARAVGLFRRACEGDAEWVRTEACLLLGELHERGQGVAKDEAIAIQLYGRVCPDGYEHNADGHVQCKEVGFGSGHGRLGGSHRARPPQVRMGATHVSGRVTPRMIFQATRLQMDHAWSCYERALVGNPNLQGRVTVRFVIGRDGSVSNVSNGGSTMPDGGVVSCVIRAVYGFSFPPPEGGIVTVTLPFEFAPDP
jgi:TPR repeat protein